MTLPTLPVRSNHASRGAAARGFTLLELLVVMVIIGLLAAYVGPKYFAQIGKSEVTISRAQIDALSKALDSYRLDMGHYPSTEQGLGLLLTAPVENAEKWNGPYLSKKVPLDPWGHAYVYRNPGSQGAFDLLSQGRDGKPGGSGDSTEISH